MIYSIFDAREKLLEPDENVKIKEPNNVSNSHLNLFQLKLQL